MNYLVQVFRTQTFRSLYKHRNYRLFFVGNIVSLTGNWLDAGAETWLVLQLTHSAVAVGILALAFNGPYVLLGLFGSALTDRLDRRQTLIWTQGILMFCSGLLAVLTLLHVITVWEVYCIAAICSVVHSLNNPIRQAFIIQLVGREDLPGAVALNAGISNFARILGPVIGGFLIVVAGIGSCFALNAVSYIGVILALVLMHPNELYDTQKSQEKVSSILKGIAEGLAYIWGTPLVRLAFALLLFMMTLSVNFDVLLPLLTAQTLHSGPEVYGILYSCLGIGSLVGAISSASLRRVLWPMLLVGAGGIGVAQLLLAPLENMGVCAVLLVLLGICYALYTSASNVMVQLTAPNKVQGRVAGLYSYINTGIGPLGSLFSGWLCLEGGTPLAFLIAGSAAVIMTLIGCAAIAARRVERR